MRVGSDEQAEQPDDTDAFTAGLVSGWKLALVYYADETREDAHSDESLEALLEAVEAEGMLDG